MNRALLLIVGCVASKSDSQACRFLGARFAQTSSVYNHGFCSGISESSDGVIRPEASFSRLPCHRAVEIIQLVSGKEASADSGLLPLTLGEREIESHVFSIIQRVILGIRMDLLWVSGALGRFYRVWLDVPD